ncbi:MAG: ATP-binding protein [Gemmatimonadales bacterium]
MISLRVLGPVEVTLDGRAAPAELLWRKNLALLIYLARSPRRARTREHLMGLLWGDKPETAARHSLREAIRALRQAAGEAVLATEGDQVRIADDAVITDVERFETLVAARDWAGAALLAEGDFLEGFGIADAPPFEDWLAAERRSVRERLVLALVSRADAVQRAGDLAAAVECARRALAIEPISGAAARALIAALALRGERAAALAAYDAFAAALHDLVGTEPDEPTRRLVEQVRRERVGAAPRAPAQGAESRRAPLVGRESEMERLVGAWADARKGRAAVVLIEGPDGSGRTRLLEELAARTRLDGAVAVHVRGAPADRSEPWSGILGLVRGGLLDAPGVAAAPPEALAAFATRFEDWGDRFPAARRAEPLAPGAALAQVARAAVAERPLALIVDDAQWLDSETLRALHALGRDLAAHPLLMACAIAPQPPRDELDELRSRVGRELRGVALTLAPLGPAHLRTLARWAMPAYTDVETDRLARRLAADSAGLPLLAVELLHAVALGLDLHGTPHAWPEPERTMDQSLPGDLPDAIVAAVRIGFRRLAKPTQAVLVAAAVIGDRVTAEQLARITELPLAEVTAALDEAEWQRWLAADARGYGFVARLARAVVARDMVTEGQRRRLQERLTIT